MKKSKIRLIIREEIKKTFNEDNSSFKMNSKIISDMYKSFNAKYFDNKLKTYPIFVKTLKSVSAKVVSFGVRSDLSTWVIKKIVFSNAISYTKDEIMGIVLHEMIHVKLIETQTQHPKIQHDRVFRKELEKLQHKSPFDIPLSEDITDKNVNADVIKKKKQVAIFTKKNGIYNGIYL